MDIIKIIGIGLIGLIITIILKQYKPEFSIYISLIAGALILVLALDKLTGIVQLLKSMAQKSSFNNQFLLILLKITGIAILTEFAGSICKDAGEGAIAKKIELGGSVLIMAISVPILSELLETILMVLP